MRASTTLLAGALVLAVGALVFACRDDGEAAAETRLLELDGLRFTLDELAPYIAFLDSVMPEGGRKTKIQKVLDDHVIPLRLAQRAFAAERQQLKERAEALCAVASNVEELERHSALLEPKGRFQLSRLQAKLPAAMFLFDPLHLRAVSPPLEMPQGWLVVAAYDLHETQLILTDYVDALEVAFVTHPTTEWIQWYAAQKAALASTATFVHPDYRTAMPDWIQLPKQP